MEKELFKSMKILGIDRMPTASELQSIGRNDLHCRISRTKKYRGWAEQLDLKLKSSETTVGQRREKEVKKILKDKGYQVSQMTTKHPYDLLINNVVKIDVKTANPYTLNGSRVHTFGINKVNPTCDLYICLSYNEQGEVERTLVIPSHLCRVRTLCIGKESKYNRFNNRWDYIEKYARFLGGVS